MRKKIKVFRITVLMKVSQIFIPNPENKSYINHKEMCCCGFILRNKKRGKKD